jgi:sugar lactone lactonase YvrE
MYVVGSGSDRVHQYSLATAWDISTATLVQNFSVSAQDRSPEGVTFSPDGTRMYVVGSGNDAVYQHSLSTAWDISTATFVQNFSVSGLFGTPTGLAFRPNGTMMYVVEDDNNSIWEYKIG